MNLETLFKDIGKIGAKVFLNKEEKSSVKINVNQMDPGDILKILLKRFIIDGEYNKAENMIFDEISKNNSQEMHQIALDFYDMLLEKSDEQLKEGGFTREEIYQGLEDLKKYRRKQMYKNKIDNSK
jgi:hypothetical protein